MMAMTWSERLEAKGREEGRQEGRLLGMREVLVGLLEQRFGPLPVETRERIEAITSAERPTWLSLR